MNKLGFWELWSTNLFYLLEKEVQSLECFSVLWRGGGGGVVSDTDEIAETDSGNHRVQIFDSSGNYLRSFGVQASARREFSARIAVQKQSFLFS